MAIYDKPVRLLMKDMVSELNLTKGQVLSKDQITSWFSENYSKIRPTTVAAHLIRMSTNAPSRVHHRVSPDSDDDLFFQIDSSHFRLYNPEIDPAPIYEKKDLSYEAEIEEFEDFGFEQPTEFAYERDLKNFLAKNLPLLDPNLKLYEDEGVTGIEFPVGGRFIDILAVNNRNEFVVIELKVSRGYDRVVGQLLRYMGWIEKNLAESGQRVRGIIVAREISEDLILATSKVNDVELFEYELFVKLNQIHQS